MASSPTQRHHLLGWGDLITRGFFFCRLGCSEHAETSRAVAVIQVVGYRVAHSRKLKCGAVKYESSKVSLIELVQQKRKQQQQQTGGKWRPPAYDVNNPPSPEETVEFSRDVEVQDQQKVPEIFLGQEQVAYELEEAKVLLSEYLKNELLAPHVPSIVSKATRFLTHLISLLHSQYQIKYLSGRELTTTEIRNSLRSYLEISGIQQGSRFIDYIVSFPYDPPPRTELADVLSSTPKKDPKTVKKKRKEKLRDQSDHMLSHSLIYLSSLGMTSEQLALILKRCPQIVSYKVEENIKPVIEFCLSLGVEPSQIPGMVLKRPQILKCNVVSNLQYKINHLEGLGVEKKFFPKILVHFPHMLTYSRKKASDVVKFLGNLGLSPSETGAVLVRFPHVVGYSIALKLKPVTIYLATLGVSRVSAIIVRSPQTLGLSLEDNIKPTVSFFVSKGFGNDEIATIISRFPQILGLNLSKNLQKKWDFFCQMDCPKSEIVKFPQYFGYDLQNRIKPRYEIVIGNNLKWGLNRLLSNPDSLFLKMVKKCVLDAQKTITQKKYPPNKETSIVDDLQKREAL